MGDQPIGDHWEVPPLRYIPAHRVLAEMADFGHRRLNRLSSGRVLVLAVIGGWFITVGALLSVLLAEGVGAPGIERLLEGVGFSAGFFFVILSEAVLFTEANVVIPTTLLDTHEARWKVVRFWAIAWVGNFAGALSAGWLIALTHDYSPELLRFLGEVVERKMAVAAGSSPDAWGRVFLSGILANWLVGMAALFAVMGRTILGKYVPIALAVILFVAANFQHSPANMGYFSLLLAETSGPGWIRAIAWNIVPAGLGNLVGGAVLVAIPFWYAFKGLGEEDG